MKFPEIITWAVAAIICLAFLFFMLVRYHTDPFEWDWGGFMGSILGGGITLFVGRIAWLAVQRQIHNEQNVAKSTIYKEIAVFSSKTYDICSMVMFNCEMLIKDYMPEYRDRKNRPDWKWYFEQLSEHINVVQALEESEQYHLYSPFDVMLFLDVFSSHSAVYDAEMNATYKSSRGKRVSIKNFDVNTLRDLHQKTTALRNAAEECKLMYRQRFHQVHGTLDTVN